jgi:hypothetical protein
VEEERERERYTTFLCETLMERSFWNNQEKMGG